MMDYMINNLQAFIFERGRTQGILHSDNEDTLNALLKATASKVGSMTVRHSPSYSSNSQGSVARLHKTLLGQIRVVKAQVESNYSMTMSTSTTTQETSKSRPTDAEMHLARKSFRNRRKLRRNGIRRTKGTNSTETTTGLQIRSRTVEQSFRGHHDGTPTIRRSQHCWIRSYNRQRKEGPRKISDNRRTRRTTSLQNPQQNNTTTHYTTSTTSVYIDVKFTTTAG